MPDEKISLADRIRDKLDARRLPRVLPEKMWSGYGHGSRCDGCGQPIRPAQIEYQFERDEMFRLHIGCLGMWVAERRRRGLVEQNGA
jgi:hypothetical protein